MSIYCGDVRMPLDPFIDCLDEGLTALTKFEQALTCSGHIAADVSPMAH